MPGNSGDANAEGQLASGVFPPGLSTKELATDFILPLNHLRHSGQLVALQTRALSTLETQAQNKQCGRRHESTLVSTRLFPVR